MNEAGKIPEPPPEARVRLLEHFGHVQFPRVPLDGVAIGRHLQRSFGVYAGKVGDAASWPAFFEGLYAADWFLACACLEGLAEGWDQLFAARASRGDCLLVDALRARAARLYPRAEERQENAVTEFWTHLIVSETANTPPVLARFDGQRPLVPWLIRVFQNWHVSQLRHDAHRHALPDDDLALPLPARETSAWHDAFRTAASAALAELTDTEVLILGLRVRYRLSQREVAALLGLHEGTISRQTTHLRDRCLTLIARRLTALGWTGDDLTAMVLTEMGSLVLDDPRLSADQLARLLATRGAQLPATTGHEVER